MCTLYTLNYQYCVDATNEQTKKVSRYCMQAAVSFEKMLESQPEDALVKLVKTVETVETVETVVEIV